MMTRKPRRISICAVRRKNISVTQLVQVLLLFVRSQEKHTTNPHPGAGPDRAE